MDNFDKLVEVLNTLFNTKDLPVCEEDGRLYFDRSDLEEEAEGLCDMELIADGGRCNYDNIMKLREKGFAVFPGERDSFGWLTGCVRRLDDDRILVYG